jgi:hypothetical protein
MQKKTEQYDYGIFSPTLPVRPYLKANGCAAHDWGQMLTLRVKTCSHFRSFIKSLTPIVAYVPRSRILVEQLTVGCGVAPVFDLSGA